MKRFALYGSIGLMAVVSGTGCSAIGGSTALPDRQSGPSATAAGAKKAVQTVIEIVVPRQGIRPDYVSAGTHSVEIAIKQKGTPVSHVGVNLSPATNDQCENVANTFSCKQSVSLAPGAYIASFATYTGYLNKAGKPTGKELSANQDVPLKVPSKGLTVSIDDSLRGLPAQLLFLPAESSSLVGTQAKGYTLSRCVSSPQQVTVLGVDASGFVIIGAGAPKPSLKSSDASVVTVTKPSPLSPNLFTLQVPSIPAGDTQVHLKAALSPAKHSGGAKVKANVGLTFQNDACTQITEYTIPDGGVPWGIAAGPDDAMWFTEDQGNRIGRITTAGSITEYSIPTSGSYPTGISAGPDTAMWFTEGAANKIGRITTVGSISEYPVPTAGADPYGIAAGPDGALWFTEIVKNKIGRITTTGSVVEYSIPTANSAPYNITAGPDGALWFTEENGNQIGRITTTGSLSEYPVPTAGATLAGIVTGPDDALWFAECGVDQIARITTTGSVTEYSLPANANGASSWPYGITVGTDSALWFTEEGESAIGRISTAGAISASSTPTQDSSPLGIALGSDGDLWFAQADANQIGRLQVTSEPTAVRRRRSRR